MESPLKTWVAKSEEKIFHKKPGRWWHVEKLSRCKLVDDVIGLGVEFGCQKSVIHRAIDAYDALLTGEPDKRKFPEQHYMIGCLVVATKTFDGLYPLVEWLVERGRYPELIFHLPALIWEITEARVIPSSEELDPAQSLWMLTEIMGDIVGHDNHGRAHSLARYYTFLLQMNGGIKGCTVAMMAALCIAIARVHEPDEKNVPWPRVLISQTGITREDILAHGPGFLVAAEKPKWPLYSNLMCVYKKAASTCMCTVSILFPATTRLKTFQPDFGLVELGDSVNFSSPQQQKIKKK